MSDDPPGFTPEEIERGEDQASHISDRGCLIFLAFLAGGAAYFLMR